MAGLTMTSDTSEVRQYRSGDRTAVWRIAGDTAFFGQPIETFLDDRQHFLDLFVSCYTEFEPQYIWVAEMAGEAVGYLLGCPDTARMDRLLRRRRLPGVLWRSVSGRYRIGRKTWRYVVRMALAQLREEYPSADLAIYPAHLHINVAEGWRGGGLGRRLLEAYLGQLRAEGVVGVHLHTTTYNHAAVYLYQSIGFELLESRRTRMWEGLIQEPMDNLVLGMLLAAD